MTGTRLSRRNLVRGAGALIVSFRLAGSAKPAAAQSIWADPNVQIESNPELDSWIRIAEDNHVTLFTGKVELGTGILTALSQIVADELYVDFDQLTIVSGDTDIVPDQGGTTATATIGVAAVATRAAAATARQTLLDLGAGSLGADSSDLEIAGGVIQVKGDASRKVTYGELVGGTLFERAVDASAPLKDPGEYTIVGQSIPRIDIPEKVTAASGDYMENARVPGMLFARTLRAPSYGATLTSYDETVADQPGIVAVLPFRSPGDERLARVEALNVMPGDFIAVVAEEENQAIRAIARLQETAVWEPGEGLPTTDAGLYDWMLENAQPIDNLTEDFQEPLETRLAQYEANREAATSIVEATYRGPYLCYGAISSAWSLADVSEDSARIWTASQGPFTAREMVAQALGFASPDQVQVFGGSSSGLYGRRDATDQEVDVEAAIISQAVGAPVRLQWTREQDFVWAQSRPPQIVKLEAVLDDANSINGVRAQIYTATRGTYAPLCAKGMEESPYLLGPTPIEGHDAGPLLRTGYMRNVFSGYNVFSMESFMDELAAATGTDPAQFRLDHLDDQRAIDVINAATERAGWEPHQGPSGRGMGLSFALYIRTNLDGPTVTYMCYVAEVDVARDTGEVRVRKLTCAIDPGLVINPDGVKNQVEGGAIQATSWALREKVTFDNQIITSRDWVTYPILTFPETPEVDVVVITRPDQPAKGIGEPVTVPVSSAIANAIFDATGARVRETPFTPERVLAAMEEAPLVATPVS